MRKAVLLLIGLALLNACTSSEKHPNDKPDSIAVHDSVKASNTAGASVKTKTCEAGETLVYENPDVFSTYTEDKMRGSGVISFQLDVNNRLDIYYPDQSTFGFLVRNEDGGFYTLDMPRKLVARWVITDADFAQFDFDAEAIDTDKDYLIIYANKEKLMVKKADVKYTFNKWEDYIRSQTIELKSCNLLAGAAQYRDMLYDVTEVNGDRIKIRSSKDCSGPDVNFKPLEGWINWKKNGNLLVDLSNCD